MLNPVSYDLKERVKELTLLHKTARLLQDDNRPAEQVITEIANAIPAAWQYPEFTAARISFDQIDIQTENFQSTSWLQTACFTISNNCQGLVEVSYLIEKPIASEGPFLTEERDLIDSIADMLRTYFQHKADHEALQLAHDNLEQQVADRTAELHQMNEALQRKIEQYHQAQLSIENYQKQLRKMASDLSLTEAKERRKIASDLHDHIGQALAFIKMKVSEFRGDSIFSGMDSNIDEILNLVNQTIQYTRSLTFEISTPVLYELGLFPAIEWLAETFTSKHKLKIRVRESGRGIELPEAIRVMLFKSAHELLVNVVKHANATNAEVIINWSSNQVTLSVADNGVGFHQTMDIAQNYSTLGFGLFSIRERITHFGGSLTAENSPKGGSCVTVKAPLNYEN